MPALSSSALAASRVLAIGLISLGCALVSTRAHASCRPEGIFIPNSPPTPMVIRDSPPPRDVPELPANTRGVLWADGPDCAAGSRYMVRWSEGRWQPEALVATPDEDPSFAAVWLRPRAGWRVGEAYRFGVSCDGEWTPRHQGPGCYRRRSFVRADEQWTQLRVTAPEPDANVVWWDEDAPAFVSPCVSWGPAPQPVAPLRPWQGLWLELLAGMLALAFAADAQARGGL